MAVNVITGMKTERKTGIWRDIGECKEQPGEFLKSNSGTVSTHIFQGICQHSCRNTLGSYRCYCRTGFQLNSNNKTCDDINECEKHDPRILCKSPASCRNTLGSYNCSCPTGFISYGGRYWNGKKDQ
jgi:hypothetical protein